MNVPHPAGLRLRPECLRSLALALLLSSQQAMAQPTQAAAATADVRAGKIAFTGPMMVRLLDLLVANGQLTRAQADQMIADAVSAGGGATAQADEPNTLIIPYVPQSVRTQIKDELKQEQLAAAKASGVPPTPSSSEGVVYSSLAETVRLYGDLRVRSEWLFNEADNATLFPNFGSINAGSGFNINTAAPGFVNPPFINTTEDRSRLRIRARMGIEAKIAPWVSINLRLATGSDTSPVSTNQTLGQGSNLGKYAVWLDRAAIRLTPVMDLVVDAGRFANPFVTSDLLFDEDLNFDGFAASYGADVATGLKLSGSVGAFPLFNTDLNFGSNSIDKSRSRDKWLLAIQGRADFSVSPTFGGKAGIGYFAFDNIEGQLSEPCLTPTSADTCSTDSSRPQFQQFGNTMFGIRQFAADPNPAAIQLQYFGLASKFRVLNVRGELGYLLSPTYRIGLEGDFVRNLAFSRSSIAAQLPVNNLADGDDVTTFDGGGTGWLVRLSFGSPEIKQFPDFNVSAAYRYLETDAVVDAFTDSDFHFGGTNSEGYVLRGDLGLVRNTRLGVRWLSADTITGPRFSNDVLFLDLNAAF